MQILFMALSGVLALVLIWSLFSTSKLKTKKKELEQMVEESKESIKKLSEDLDLSSEEFKNLRMRQGQITIKYKSEIEGLEAKIREFEKAAIG